MKFLLIPLAMFSISAHAQNPPGLSSDWVRVASSRDEMTVFYVNPKTIVKDGQTVKAWTASVQKDNNRSAKLLFEINCKTLQERHLAFHSYSLDFSKVTGTVETPKTWNYIIPDSVSSTQAKAICEYKPK